MKKWRKNLVAGAVLLTVCAGIYVNWYYGEKEVSADLTDMLNEEKILSSDKLVMADADLTILTDNTSTLSEYFASVRLSRQEARDEAVALLQEAMSYTEGEVGIQTGTQLDQIVQTGLCEAQIESLIIAKGYADCVAYIGDEGISVAVASPEGGLGSADVAVIADVVLTQTGFSLDEIRIVEVF